MKRGWFIGTFLLIIVLAPFASQKPDAVQRLLGISGGPGGALKALLGAGLTAAAVVVLIGSLRWVRRRRRM